MADASRSIESILAALAAQRPPTTSTPTQGHPPHPAPSYSPAPGAYPPAGPPGSAPPPYAGAYGLPQPSSSGTYDLSAIKPVNSGSVNIADAIAQAKAYAADKGITPYQAPPGSYPPHNSHSDSRNNFRSRSRSPSSRRDPYNDNYNPYRDERRDDRGGRSREYGRDRSRSPGARGHFSPRGGGGGGGGGGRGGDDDDTETIEIESSLVGLIIGRQGENLRRVESSTGCRVQFIPPTDKSAQFRQCKITGPRAARADAAAQINKIVEDSGMGAIARAGLNQAGRGSSGPGADAVVPQDGEDCMQIMVPDRTVGLIIGRGGETIRDLQERSGCHINIVAENKSVNGLRPVNLIGSREASAQAKELILEIVDSDSRNDGAPKGGRPPRQDGGRDGGHQGGYGGGGGGGGGGAFQGGGGDKINDRIYVPSDAVGMIIGKGGETIREMQNSTGCKINVSQSSGPGETEREIGLVGSRDAIQRAKQAIEDKVDAVRQKNNGGTGGGRGGRPSGGRRDYDNPNYTPQNAQAQPAAAAAAAPAGGDDPYAPYGGYQAYLALWYQSIAAQQQQGGAKPPGA